MKKNDQDHVCAARLGFALSFAAALLLAGCGGGGSSSPAPASTTPSVSAQTVQDVSSNTAAVPTSSSDAVSSTVTATQALVASAQASQTYTCPGGGSAVYTVAGASLAELTNGQFDTGEVYSVTYTSCKGIAGLASIDGALGLTVNSATGTFLDLSTSTSNLVVSVPLGTVTLDGSSTLTFSTSTSGTTTTETWNWQTPSYTVTSNFGTRTSTWDYTNINRTRTVVLDNGVVSSTSYSGTTTISVTHPNSTWSATLSSQGGVEYVNGVPVSGSWTCVLPSATIDLSVASGTVTVTVDWGSNGTVDATYTYTNTDLIDSAG